VIESYEYDWRDGHCTDPAHPRHRPLPTPPTMIYLDGVEFVIPVARCVSGEEGMIEYMVQDESGEPKIGDDRRPTTDVVHGCVKVVITGET